MPNPKPKLENLKSYKPKWKSGKTRTIRVPIAIADRVLEVAHQIDEDISLDTSELLTIDKHKETTTISSKNRNCIIDTSDTIKEEIKSILDQALAIKSNQGSKIKTKIAELGKYWGWKIEKANKKAAWTITETSET